MKRSNEGRVDIKLPPPCSPLMVKNCQEMEHFDKCKLCEKGYFLDESKQCQPFSIPRIENCMTYSNYNVCTKCIQGFHLINEQLCKAVKLIEKCVEYN